MAKIIFLIIHKVYTNDNLKTISHYNNEIRNVYKKKLNV